uniref:Selenoprotein V n=1 Tax=Neovison vison TaxID=452646 RepID=A0A8C7B771_NEOVI
ASAWTPSPAQAPPQTPTTVPTLAQTPPPIHTPASAQTQVSAWTPAQTQVSAWSPTFAQSPAWPPTPVQMPTPAQTPTPVQTLTQVWNPTPVRTPTRARMPTRVQTPIPAQTPTTIWTPPPVPAPTPVSSRVGVEITTAIPVSQSFPDSVLPLDQPTEPASEPASSRDKDLSRPPSVKHFPSVTSEFGFNQESILVHTPSASDLLRLTLGSTSKTDSSATKLTDSTPESEPVPILGPGPLAPASENFPMDKKILIRVIYCGLSYSLRFILLRKSLEQQFPNRLHFQEERAAQATGEFEVFVDGKLVHSKKKGDGFVDEAGLQKIFSIIEEEISKR